MYPDRPKLCRGEAGDTFLSSSKVPSPPHALLSYSRAEESLNSVTALTTKSRTGSTRLQDRCLVQTLCLQTCPVSCLLGSPLLLTGYWLLGTLANSSPLQLLTEDIRAPPRRPTFWCEALIKDAAPGLFPLKGRTPPLGGSNPPCSTQESHQPVQRGWECLGKEMFAAKIWPGSPCFSSHLTTWSGP